MLEPIKTGKLYELIMERISDYIDDNQLKPGDRIPSERAFATKLSVSRSSVRQAISALSAQGIVKVAQGDGTFVAKHTHISKDSLYEKLKDSLEQGEITPVEITEVREYIECEMARLCALRATDIILQRLKALEIRIKNFDADADSLNSINNDLHVTIAFGSENTILDMILMSILHLMHDNVAYWIPDSPTPPSQLDREKQKYEHEQIIEAILKKDESLSHFYMQKHLKNMKKELAILSDETNATKKKVRQ